VFEQEDAGVKKAKEGKELRENAVRLCGMAINHQSIVAMKRTCNPQF
jgi:hypothetical protein